VGIVALEDGMAVAVETERDAMSGDHSVQSAQIAESIFGFELEVSGEDLTGSVILKADESELGAAAFEPVMAAGVGKRHHAQTGTGRPAGAILAGSTLLRRGQFGGAQDAAHRLATDREAFSAAKFFRQMRIVEALVLAASQLQDQLLLGKRNRPGHGTSAISVLHPADRIGPIAALEALYLAFTQLQQAFSITFTRWNSF
jgi:hypothetical protein